MNIDNIELNNSDGKIDNLLNEYFVKKEVKKGMPFVSDEFVIWFFDLMRDEYECDFNSLDSKKIYFNAGRMSVLKALLTLKSIENNNNSDFNNFGNME